MTTVNEVVDFWKSQADAGLGVDNDGLFGYQCADLPCYTTNHFFGVQLWGNAIDLLAAAENAGLKVEYDAVGVNPKKGDLFVMSVVGHNFGHTGIVIEDSDGYTIKTIEQNINPYQSLDSKLTVGGAAMYNERDFSGIIGWIRPPYTDATPTQTTTQATTTNEENGGANMFTFYHVTNDNSFPNGAIFIANFLTNTIYPAADPDELVYLNERVKETTGRDIPMKEYETGAPIIRVMGATGMKKVDRNW